MAVLLLTQQLPGAASERLLRAKRRMRKIAVISTVTHPWLQGVRYLFSYKLVLQKIEERMTDRHDGNTKNKFSRAFYIMFDKTVALLDLQKKALFVENPSTPHASLP